jgi:hypothetical protein
VDAAVLKSVVHNYYAFAAQALQGLGALVRDQNVHVGTVAKVLAHHEGFVAHVFGGVFEQDRKSVV